MERQGTSGGVVGPVCISTIPSHLVFHICNTMLCIPVSKLKDEIK